MSDRRTTARAFHDAGGVEDWRVLFNGDHAYFRVGSFAEAARFVPDPPSIQAWPRPYPHRRQRPGRPGQARVAAPIEAGGRLADATHVPHWWTLASPDNHGVDIAAWPDFEDEEV